MLVHRLLRAVWPPFPHAVCCARAASSAAAAAAATDGADARQRAAPTTELLDDDGSDADDASTPMLETADSPAQAHSYTDDDDDDDDDDGEPHDDDEPHVAAPDAWKAKRRFFKGRKLIDAVRIRAVGGRGGNGCVSFRREKYVPRGGPDGGSGGAGGSVRVVVDGRLRDLSHVVHVNKAADGVGGAGRDCDGRAGSDAVVRVPRGVLVRRLNSDTGVFEPFAELGVPVGAEVLGGDSGRHAEAKPVQTEAVLARGGVGGRGNKCFTDSVRRAPRFAEQGTRGDEFVYELELRCIADVGLVGVPNAGKSSLLAALTNARPRVAAYPFTTINPYVGVISYDDDGAGRQLAIADIPGIIEGAHRNIGMGLRFLRHVERASVLVFVVSMGDPDEGTGAPLAQLSMLLDELSRHGQASLLAKPCAYVGTKLDTAGAQDRLAVFERDLRDARISGPVFGVSAHTGAGLDMLVDFLRAFAH